MHAELHVFPCLDDNIGVLLRDSSTGACASIDAPEEGPIIAGALEKGWKLTDILVTHRHGDHVGGVESLKRRLSGSRRGAGAGSRRSPPSTLPSRRATRFWSARSAARSLTRRAIRPVTSPTTSRTAKALFAGDTFFALGCGRVFEGSAADMWRSLQKLAALPDDTRSIAAMNTRWPTHVSRSPSTPAIRP